jgi:ABC-2 type transport system ATP-binding protein
MIETKKLRKSFKSFKKEPGVMGSVKSLFHREYITKNAVEDFDLSIETGEMVALLGPNGAGKTTLMKMFTGIIVPSDGEVLVAGHKPFLREKQFRKKVAIVMGQKSQLWWDLPAMDSFLLLQKYYEIPPKAFKKRLDLMNDILRVGDLLHVHMRKMSLGERMKMELIASLLHAPEVIFLDEPTIGLDVMAQENIRKFIHDYHAENKVTVVLTSHYMADVQALCKRLVLIFNGMKGFDGPIEKFEKILGHEKILSITSSEAIDLDHPLLANYSPTFSNKFRTVELKIPEDQLSEIGAQILQQLPIIDFSTEKLPIERVMKTLVECPDILLKDRSAP